MTSKTRIPKGLGVTPGHIWSAKRCLCSVDEPRQTIYAQSPEELKALAAEVKHPFEETVWDVTEIVLSRSLLVAMANLLQG